MTSKMVAAAAENSEKKKIREEKRNMRNAMKNEEVERKSQRIAQRLLQLDDYKRAKTVLFYAAKGNEVQTKKLIEEALGSGKRVLLPITDLIKKEIEISEIKDYGSDLREGAFGVMEPKQRNRYDESRIDVVVVPMLAFDSEGNRLGYGLGLYDKLLHRLKRKRINIRKIGLAYGFQMAEKLPNNDSDQKVDVIITESETIMCGE